MSEFAKLPKVDRVLDLFALASGPWRRSLAKVAVVTEIEGLRRRLREEAPGTVEIPSAEALAERVAAILRGWMRSSPRRVVNATGVLLHTNLGRAVLGAEAVEAMQEAAGACDLEFERSTGRRGSRFSRFRPFASALLGAQDVHVVNNGAAALLLACTALNEGGGIGISRGQMVEIGDGFRVADMAAAAGARLLEVGSTNRTHLADYDALLEDLPPGTHPASALLWVHLSNFSQRGFVRDVALSELATLAQAHGIPLIADLGSGSLGGAPLSAEPTVTEYLEAGVDVVIFSGDKLLGGPQAGLMAGRADLIERCRRHPMARALRPDKTCLAALHATLIEWARVSHEDEAGDELGPEAVSVGAGRPRTLPLYRMLEASTESLMSRARELVGALGWGSVAIVESVATLGGGALPGDTLPSVAIVVPTEHPSRSAYQLRGVDPAVVGRIREGELVIDLRSVLPEEDDALLAGLKSLTTGR